ncbi:MAG: MotA/TolQ/ExbB proton channel family protein [Cytophagales bacterium]|nr:MAG: MotA/TolQ/ExbB proton channel family protein [Cytophagales bacterium]TAF59785.1 MAG: MotA/TolQ/ExbB proton channel family protein [Cytophagales bacterium]
MSKPTSGPSQASSMFALITIPVIIVICVLLYIFVLGNPSNFQENNPDNHPIPGNYLGIVYKGGVVVPILMAFFLMVIVFSIERFLTITRAKGAGSIATFVRKIKSNLEADNVSAAIAECDKQKGSVGNVIRAVLLKYQDNSNAVKKERNKPVEVVGNTGGNIVIADVQDKEQRMASIQKELEDSTSLELPMLEKNLTIIATLASVATLTGLLGTVIGMIKAFAALATAGAPDSSALANGISEALINTALGIGASAFAIIFYNYFTSEIDNLTYSIDEAGYSILQSYSVKH